MTSTIAFNFQREDLLYPSPEVVVGLYDVGVLYRRPTERVRTLKEYFIRRAQRRRISHREFWALRNIDLEIKRGEILGIIGRNGAGKSTLLKVVSRIVYPMEGRVVVRGTLTPLLQLGAAFHPLLTGRENIYLNGSLLGYSQKEMETRFEQIVEFAELAEFIDNPVRIYSSGMTARLGFGIASTLNPDILVLDEVLSVGDTAFQKKCFARIDEFCKTGTTVLLVSHSLDSIRQFCHRAIWMEHGRICADGTSEQVVAAYLGSLWFSHVGDPPV